MISRRRLLTGFVLAWAPLRAAAAQEYKAGKVWRIGILEAVPKEAVTAFDRALEDELRQLGYTGGQNVTFEYRYSGWTPEQLPELANSLVRANVDVIVAGTNPAIAAAKQATNAIPIVMGLGTAPVQAGFVKSLGQPGGNITGLTSDPTLEILGKELQLLKEATPKLSRVAVVWNSSVPAYAEFFQALVSASRQAGVVLQSVPVERPEGFPPAFADIIRQRAGAVFVFADALTFGHRQQLADFANGRRLPMSGYMREFAEAGCLLSYGPNLVAIYRCAATYIDKILKGAKPADLPIQQPTKFELVINLKTAKALGLTIPPSLLSRADEVIQ